MPEKSLRHFPQNHWSEDRLDRGGLKVLATPGVLQSECLSPVN